MLYFYKYCILGLSILTSTLCALPSSDQEYVCNGMLSLFLQIPIYPFTVSILVVQKFHWKR